ncbi:MAG TPA: ATP-binding protein [Candidatus Dormibacteraeota bacterium]
MVRGSPANATPTASGLTFNLVTLKWRAAILFGGQLFLVAGGVLALLLIQHDQRAAVASADSARRAQVLEADYFAGMVQTESAIQEYLDTGDSGNLVQYHDSLTVVAATGSALKLTKTDATERRYLDQMFSAADGWLWYATGALSPDPPQATESPLGDNLFTYYTTAQLQSTAYLETLVAKAAADESDGANREILALVAIAAVALVSVIAGGGLIYRSIRADRRKLHQVLLNLLSNAIKFTLPEGCVTVVHQRTDDVLLLTVVDTGIGIAHADQERIFGAFEQVPGANRDGGGTGLGLALSRRFVELHHGRLWLESEIGQGSSFHISLPVSGPPVAVPEEEVVSEMAALLQK